MKVGILLFPNRQPVDTAEDAGANAAVLALVKDTAAETLAELQQLARQAL